MDDDVQTNTPIVTTPTGDSSDRAHIESLMAAAIAEAASLTHDDQTAALLYEALALADELGDLLLLQTIHHNLAKQAYYRGEIVSAIRHGQEAADRALALGDAVAHFNAQTILGNTHAHIGDFDTALSLFNRFFRLPNFHQLHQLFTAIYSNIGAVYIRLEQWEKALEQTLLSLEYLDEVSPADRNRYALNAYDNLSFIYFNMGDGDGARRTAEQGIAYFKARGVPVGNSLMMMLGRAYQLLDEYDQALYWLEQARESKVGMQGEFWEGLINMYSSSVYIDCRRYDEAQRQLHSAHEHFLRVNADSEIIQVYEQMTRLYKARGDHASALEYFEKFYKLKQKLFNERADVRLKTIQALHDVEIAQLERATEFQRAEGLRSELEKREQLIADLDSYARTVAHDLINPLNVVYGASDLLIMDAENMDRESRDTLHNAIYQSAKKALQIIETLLQVARMQRQEIAPHPVVMRAVIDEVLTRLDNMITDTHAAVTVTETMPSALGDAHWLEEVWVNLISNAIKYGGAPPVIVIDGSIDGDQAHYTIHDNGDGITSAEQQRLFSAFSRLDRHQKTIEGHGLGLNIVRTIVEKLDGRIWVESEGIAGKGTIFHFTLRVAPEQ